MSPATNWTRANSSKTAQTVILYGHIVTGSAPPGWYVLRKQCDWSTNPLKSWCLFVLFCFDLFLYFLTKMTWRKESFCKTVLTPQSLNLILNYEIQTLWTLIEPLITSCFHCLMETLRNLLMLSQGFIQCLAKYIHLGSLPRNKYICGKVLSSALVSLPLSV